MINELHCRNRKVQQPRWEVRDVLSKQTRDAEICEGEGQVGNWLVEY